MVTSAPAAHMVMKLSKLNIQWMMSTFKFLWSLWFFSKIENRNWEGVFRGSNSCTARKAWRGNAGNQSYHQPTTPTPIILVWKIGMWKIIYKVEYLGGGGEWGWFALLSSLLSNSIPILLYLSIVFLFSFPKLCYSRLGHSILISS
jgi:hypothetical protein